MDITTPDDFDLSYNQINNLGQNLYHTPIDKLCSFLLIVDGIAYRGTMIGLICQNVFSYNYYDHYTCAVVFCDNTGVRHIETLLIPIPNTNGVKRSFASVSPDKHIIGYPIGNPKSGTDNLKSLLNNNYSVVSNNHVVNVCQGESGYFVTDSNHNRLGDYYDSIRIEQNGLLIIERDGLFGLLDKSGECILSPRFLEIGSFSYGLAAVLDHVTCGYINTEGCLSCNSTATQISSLWGYIDTKGHLVIEPLYISASLFNGKYAQVEVSKGKSGLINKSGNAVIVRKNNEIVFPGYCIIEQSDYMLIGINKTYGTHHNIPNEILERIINYPVSFESLLFIGDCFVGHKGKKQILFSHDGKISNEVDSCSTLPKIRFNQQTKSFDNFPSNSYTDYYTDCFYLAKRNNKKGVVDNEGSIIVPFEYESVGHFTEGTILAYDGEQMLLYSIDGSKHTKPYERIELNESNEQNCANRFYVYKNQKVGVIGYNSNAFTVILPCVYDHITLTDQTQDTLVGTFIIDGVAHDHRILGSNGEYIEKPTDLSWMTDFSYYRIAIALKGEFFGLIDSQLNILLDFSYNNILKIDAFHFLISKNNNIKLIRFNRSFEAVTLMEIPGLVISRLSTFIFRVLRSGKFFIFKYYEDKEVFSELLEQGYDNVFGIDESFIVVEEGSLYGCYDNDGRKLLETKYESIIPIENEVKYPYWDRQKRYKMELTSNKIISCYYPIGHNGEFLCDLYNIESRCLLHISKSWFKGELSNNSCGIADYKKQLSVVYMVYNFYDNSYIVLGTYISLRNCSQQNFVISLDCQHFEGPFDKIEPYLDINKPFKGLSTYQNGKRGLINLNSFNVIPCVFDDPVYFVPNSNRFWIIEKTIGGKNTNLVFDSSKGCELDLKNVKSIDYVSDSIYKISIVTENNETKCGLVDKAFKQIVPFIFDSITYVKRVIDDQFIVSEKYYGDGIIDQSGNYIYPLTSGKIKYQRLDGNRILYKFYDENGVLNAISEDGYIIKDIIDATPKEFIPNSKQHYITVKNDNGTFSVCTSFGEKYADIESTYTKDDITILKSTGRYFAINTKKRITPSLHERISIYTRLQYLLIKDGTHRKFVDFNGDTICEIEGDYLGCALYKEAGVVIAKRKRCDEHLYFNLLSMDGNVIVDTDFSFIGSFNENYATCVINSDNPIDIDFFNNIKKDESGAFFTFSRGNYGQWGLINNKGEIVIPMKFDYIRPVKNGLTIYMKDRKYGIINLKENYRTAPIFKYLFSFSEGLCAFRELTDDIDMIWAYKYTNCGLINEKGQIVVPATYSRIYAFKEGIANVVSKCNYINQIDREGNLLHEWKKLPSLEESYDDYDEGYTQSELEDMYRAAYEDDPSTQWNTD